jgi:hypothetical protein
MTSIHPPAWWKGPLGPLTTGRDLYGEDLRDSICPVVRRGGERRAGLWEAHRDHEDRDQELRGWGDDRLLGGSQNGLSPPCRARHAPPLGGRGSSRR